MQTKIIFIGLAYIIFLLNACNQKNTSKTNLKDTTNSLQKISQEVALLKDIETKEIVYNVKIKEINNFKTISGTKISIPANIFVDDKGKDISSNVFLKYKEIRSASDIIVNQVDMKYDSAGVSYDFQTDGMFEMTAVCDGKPVYIKKGKNITVSFVSNSKESFGFYNYSGDNWKYSGQSKIEYEIENKNSVKDTNYNLIKPVKVNPAKDLVIDIKIPYQNIPELAIYKRILWKYAGEKDFIEVKEILKKLIISPELITSSEKGKYKLSFKIGKEKTELLIAPVFTPKDYKIAMQQFNNQTANNSKKNTIERTASVSQLGLMNYDRIYHQPDAIQVIVNFEVDDNGNTIDTQNLPLFHITGEDDVVVKQNNNNKMYFTRKMKNKLIAILPGNRIAILNSKDFGKKVKSVKSDETVTFTLKSIDLKIETAEDLNKIISTL